MAPYLNGKLEKNVIKIELFYINENEIEAIEYNNFDKNIDININYGYVVKIEDELLKCTKYINIDKLFFDNIYDEIYKMDFESIMLNSTPNRGCGYFEINIGLGKFLNEYLKKVVLWGPPYTKDEKSKIQIEKILKIYETIKEKMNYEIWHNRILLNKELLAKPSENMQKRCFLKGFMGVISNFARSFIYKLFKKK